MNGRIARELRREARVSCDPRQGLCYEDVDKKLRGMGGKVLKDKKGKPITMRMRTFRYHPLSYRAVYRAMKRDYVRRPC